MSPPVHSTSGALPQLFRQKHHSKWSAWCWLIIICSTFALAYAFASLIAALGCSIAMFASAMLQRVVGTPFRSHRVTIRSFWFLSYLVMIFFPAFFVYADHPGPYRGSFLLSVTSALVTVPIGFIIASFCSNFRESQTEAFFRRPLQAVFPPTDAAVKFSILLGAGLILIVLYMRQVETIPIFYLLRHPGEFWILSLLREESFKLLKSSLDYPFFMTRALLFPFLILLSYGYYVWTRRKAWLVAFLIALTSGVFFASLSLAKGPVALIFMLVAFFVYYWRHGSFSYKTLVLFTILVIAFPVFVIVGAGNSDTDLGQTMALTDPLANILHRLTYVPSDVVYYYHEFFPAHMHYLHGGSIRTLSSLFGLHFVNTYNVVGQYAEPGGIESISYNGAFISDMYADFGWAGTLIGGVITGIVMQTFHIYVVRRRKTVCSLVTYSFLVWSFSIPLNSTSLPSILASGGTIPILALLWLFDGSPWPNWFSRNVQQSLVRV